MRTSLSNRSILLSLKGWGIAALTGATLLACSPDPAPSLNFTTSQSANVVMGQAGFTSGSPNRDPLDIASPDANTLRYPYGSPVVAPTKVLYLPDYGNNRVLGYTTVPTTNGASADFVLGQPGFSTNTENATAAGMGGPQTVLTHNGKLLVLDYTYNRVMIWNTPPTSNNVPADVVVGQPDTATVTPGCTAETLSGPESMAVIDGSLVVADSGNNRVMVWDTIPTADGASATDVYGQPDFTTCAAGTTATTFSYPTDVVKVGAKLVLADANNNRLLIWNTVPSSPATPPDVVLGQPDFTSSTANNGGVSASSLSYPYFLATDGTRLALTDSTNNRVLIWNTVPTCTPAPCASTTGANVVLGQLDFTSIAEGLSAQGLDYPTGLYFNGPNQLFVADHDNSRSLIFNAHP